MCDCRSVFDDDGGIDLIGPFVIFFMLQRDTQAGSQAPDLGMEVQ